MPKHPAETLSALTGVRPYSVTYCYPSGEAKYMTIVEIDHDNNQVRRLAVRALDPYGRRVGSDLLVTKGFLADVGGLASNWFAIEKSTRLTGPETWGKLTAHMGWMVLQRLKEATDAHR